MGFLTTDDKQRISDAIRAVEARTSGELVTVIARESANYGHVPLLWAALVALLLPAPLLFTGLATVQIFELQWGAFIALALLLQVGPIKMAVTPPAIKRAYARRLAREQFFAQGLHRTHERSGVLIFVSLAEHYVEVIADEGINARLASNVWEQAVADFVREVKAGRVAQGFLTAIADCGETLIAHFPRAAGDTNELPNHLIEL
jgi:putative membrane protein